MFNNWFGKDDTTDLRLSGSEKNGSGNGRSTERNEQIKRLVDPRQAATEWPDRNNRKPVTFPIPSTFEPIYQTATVKPPKLACGIQKIAEMGNSPHLAGMSSRFKRKALLMALEATGTDVGEVLNDIATRQRALKESWHKEFREWQKSRQQESQRLTDADALCVPHENEEEVEGGGKVMIAQRAGDAYR